MENWQLQFKYGTLVIWPPKEVRVAVNKLRQEYDPSSHSWMEAHLTLTQPFLEEPTPLVWEKIEKTLSELPAFKIYFGPINTFKGTSVLKFQIEPENEILSLREKLHKTRYFNLSMPFTEGFIPHMTISEFGISSVEKAQELAQKLNEKIDEGSFLCHEVTYVRPDDEFHFMVKKTFQLRRKK